MPSSPCTSPDTLELTNERLRVAVTQTGGRAKAERTRRGAGEDPEGSRAGRKLLWEEGSGGPAGYTKPLQEGTVSAA